MKHIFYFIVLLFITSYVTAQPGTLDSSFGDDGKVLVKGIYADGEAIALQNDGKIIQGGGGVYLGKEGVLIARYNINGTLDLSFGTNGIVVTKLSKNFQLLKSVIIQKSGKIVAACLISQPTGGGSDIAVIRYTTNGKVDSSFGTNGIVTTDIRASDRPRGMAVQTDDKILVTGETQEGINDTETSFVVRYLADGGNDSSFGLNGIVLKLYTAPINVGNITLQRDNKILVGVDDLFGKFSVTRYLLNGRLDLSFGINGTCTVSFPDVPGYGRLYDLAVQTDGKIIAGGTHQIQSPVKVLMALIRIDSNGVHDKTFGDSTGISYTDFEDFGEGSSEATTILIQTDGKIIAAGRHFAYDNYTFTDFALARYKNNGELDSTFGSNGLVTTYMDGSAYSIKAVLQGDGKVVLGGYSSQPDLEITNCALARYNGDPIQISIVKNITVTEGNSDFTNAVFHVTINNTSSLPVKAKYKTVNGTAIAGIDYIADSGVVTIQPGRTMKKITIQVIGDNIGEPNKKFYLQIGEPTNAILGALTTASCFIKNDDAVAAKEDNNTSSAKAIRISPNPVKDILYVKGLDATDNATISIVNMRGNVLVTDVVSNGSSYIKNIAHLQQGVYYIKIQQQKKVSTLMFIKE